MLKFYKSNYSVRHVSGMNHFRNGWRYAKQLLSQHYNSGLVDLYSSIDWQFKNENHLPWVAERKPTNKYAGIIHGPPKKTRDFFESDWYKETSHLCVGFFCLSSHLITNPTIKKILYIPFTRPNIHWHIDNFIKQKGYITVGNAYRNFKFISATGLVQRHIHHYYDDHLRLSDIEYDAMLSSNVVVLNVTDEVVINGMLDCIACHTPLLINRTNTFEEYLGVDYPLFYTDLHDCVKKANDIELLYNAHMYLKTKDYSRHNGDHFISTIESCLW